MLNNFNRGTFDNIQKNPTQTTAELIEMLEDLMVGAGYSYSDISRKTKISFSEISKIANGKRREPRYQTFRTLLCFYLHTFYGAKRTYHCANYIRLKKPRHLLWLHHLNIELLVLKHNGANR